MEPIHYAARQGNEAEVIRLVQEDPRRLNAPGPRWLNGQASTEGAMIPGSTPLMYAVLGKHDAVVARLLQLGADVKLQNVARDTAAHYAVGQDDPASTLALLVDAGAPLDVRGRYWRAPFKQAVCNRAVECVKLLLAWGGKALDVSDALSLAGYRGYPEMVELLLQASADPTIPPLHDLSLLYWARRYNYHDCIPLLEAALAEPQRPRLLFKARALLEAHTPIDKARSDARDKEGLRTRAALNRRAAAVAPVYLEGRAGDGRNLPRVQLVEQVEQEQLAACVKYTLGLEGGGVVLFEGQEPTVGMVKEVFVELLEMLVPKWDPAQKGRPLGWEKEDEEREDEEEDEEEDDK